jgi:hypothetical protein
MQTPELTAILRLIVVPFQTGGFPFGLNFLQRKNQLRTLPELFSVFLSDSRRHGVRVDLPQ